MAQSSVGNAASLLGEIFLPGASQYVAGNVGSGMVHSLMAIGAGAMLIGSGAAPIMGTLAVLAVKLNSYSSATTGRNLWNQGTEVVNRAGNMLGTQPTTAGPTTTAASREGDKVIPTLLDSAPAPLYGFAPNRMDVFWKGADGSLNDTWWTGSAWETSKLT